MLIQPIDTLSDSTSVSSIVERFNLRFPRTDYPGLRLTRVEEDVAYLEIDDATQLTQRMGSQGAIDYLATATFSLTSLDGISAVSFDFPVGDHATPGEYSRASWIQHYGNLLDEFRPEGGAQN